MLWKLLQHAIGLMWYNVISITSSSHYLAPELRKILQLVIEIWCRNAENYHLQPCRICSPLLNLKLLRLRWKALQPTLPDEIPDSERSFSLQWRLAWSIHAISKAFPRPVLSLHFDICICLHKGHVIRGGLGHHVRYDQHRFQLSLLEEPRAYVVLWLENVWLGRVWAFTVRSDAWWNIFIISTVESQFCFTQCCLTWIQSTSTHVPKSIWRVKHIKKLPFFSSAIVTNLNKSIKTLLWAIWIRLPLANGSTSGLCLHVPLHYRQQKRSQNSWYHKVPGRNENLENIAVCFLYRFQRWRTNNPVQIGTSRTK